MHFSRIFGDLELSPGLVAGVGRIGIHPLIKNLVPAEASKEEQVQAFLQKGVNPYVAHISNVDTKGKHANDLPDHTPNKQASLKSNDHFANSEWEWHTDMSYILEPPKISLLHCHEVPASGRGRTSFSSMIEAYNQLTPEIRSQCKDWHLKHDSTYGSSGMIRPGMKVPESPVTALGQVHPLVRRVPPYAEEVLFLGRRTNGYIPELPLEESERVLNQLWSHTNSGVGSYTHDWCFGDMVVWDNRVLVHHREPFDPTERRVMKRTQIVGEPVLPVVPTASAARL